MRTDSLFEEIQEIKSQLASTIKETEVTKEEIEYEKINKIKEKNQ